MYAIQGQFGLSKLVDEAGRLSLIYNNAPLFDVVDKAGRTGLKARKAPAVYLRRNYVCQWTGRNMCKPYDIMREETHQALCFATKTEGC